MSSNITAKPALSEPLSCTNETSLSNEQKIELYRHLKLTRMFD